jgi:hypothetical protein
VQQLKAAFAEPGVPDDTVLGPSELEQRPRDAAGVRGISTHTLDWADQEADRIKTEAQMSAAAIVRDAEAAAEALIASAEETAARIRAEAQRAAETTRTESGDGVQEQAGFSAAAPIAYHGVSFRRGTLVTGTPWIDDVNLTRQRLWTVSEDGELQDSVEKLAATWARLRDMTAELLAPAKLRRSARTKPRQADAQPTGRLILPHLPAAVDHCRALSVDYEHWWSTRVDAASVPGTWPVVVFVDASYFHAAESSHASPEHLAGLTLIDTWLSSRTPRLLTTTRYIEASLAHPAQHVSENDEPVVITDLSAT